MYICIYMYIYIYISKPNLYSAAYNSNVRPEVHYRHS